MNGKEFGSLGKQNKTAASIIEKLGEKARSPKGGVIDLSHFRSKVRDTPGFDHQDYDSFWKTLARQGYGKYVPGKKPGEHAKFIPSQNIVEFAKMATGKVPTSIEQETYNHNHPASTSTDGPVFQIATLIMKNLRHMSDKEISFLISMLESKAVL